MTSSALPDLWGWARLAASVTSRSALHRLMRELEGPSMKLSQAVGQLVEACRRDVPDCIGAGVVDLSTGMMLASDTLDDHPDEVLEILAAATVEVFQGRAVREVEQMWKSRRGEVDPRHYFQEILINSTNLVHLFIRSGRYPDIAVAFVCSNTAKVGLLFAQARRIVRDFDAAQ